MKGKDMKANALFAVKAAGLLVAATLVIAAGVRLALVI